MGIRFFWNSNFRYCFPYKHFVHDVVTYWVRLSMRRRSGAYLLNITRLDTSSRRSAVICLPSIYGGHEWKTNEPKSERIKCCSVWWPSEGRKYACTDQSWEETWLLIDVGTCGEWICINASKESVTAMFSVAKRRGSSANLALFTRTHDATFKETLLDP